MVKCLALNNFVWMTLTLKLALLYQILTEKFITFLQMSDDLRGSGVVWSVLACFQPDDDNLSPEYFLVNLFLFQPSICQQLVNRRANKCTQLCSPLLLLILCNSILSSLLSSCLPMAAIIAQLTRYSQ